MQDGDTGIIVCLADDTVDLFYLWAHKGGGAEVGCFFGGKSVFFLRPVFYTVQRNSG